jgi:hypothetical protein
MTTRGGDPEATDFSFVPPENGRAALDDEVVILISNCRLTANVICGFEAHPLGVYSPVITAAPFRFSVFSQRMRSTKLNPFWAQHDQAL